MRVNEYRDLVSAVSDQWASFRSAANDHERRAEAQHLRRIAGELAAAKCRTAKLDDLGKAARLLDQIVICLAQHDDACKRADADFTRMSFAEEWR